MDMQDFIRQQNVKLLQAAIDKERDHDKRLVLERLLKDQLRQDASGKTERTPETC